MPGQLIALPQMHVVQSPWPGLQVWRMALSQGAPAQLAGWLTWLDKDEQARARRFVLERDRQAFIIRRAGLRGLLGQAVGQPPMALQFTCNPFGKPALASLPWQGGAPPAGLLPQFSLSHSGAWALAALHGWRRVGVDIERHAVLDDDALARRVFSTAEYARRMALPAPQRLAAFYDVWTRKEAYMKAAGLGLSLEPQSFDVDCLPPGYTPVAIDAPPGYSAAVCLGPEETDQSEIMG